MRIAIVAALAMLSSGALASPVCSRAAPKPSAECVTKLDYCKYTSIVFVLAFRSRLDGKTEDAAFAGYAANKTNEPWYARNLPVVKDVVHSIYKDDASFQKMKTLVGGGVGAMALAISDITKGCDGDPKIVVDSH